MRLLLFFIVFLSLIILGTSKTIAITRATVAAPEGEVNIDIRSAESDESEQQQLANLNTDLDRTQETISVEENYITEELGLDQDFFTGLGAVATVYGGGQLMFVTKNGGVVTLNKKTVQIPEKAAGKIAGKINSKTVDLSNTKTWPKPPVIGNLKTGTPSRNKPKARGEKSLYDNKGGEWRMQNPDKYHQNKHWNYKPPGKNTPWLNVDKNGKVIDGEFVGKNINDLKF